MSPLQAVLRNHYGPGYVTVLEGDRADAVIMAELAELRQREEKIDEELRDPESAVSMGYACIAGERPLPTASYHVYLELVNASEAV